MRKTLAALVLSLLIFASCAPEISDDSTPEEKAALAERKLEEGDEQRAIELFEEAIEEAPDNPDLPLWKLGRAEALLLAGNPLEAVSLSSQYTGSSNPVIRSRAFLLKAMAESSSTASLEALTSTDLEALDERRAREAVFLCREQLGHVRTGNLLSMRERGWFELYVLLELEARAAQSGDTERAALYGAEIDRIYPGAHDTYGRPETGEEPELSESWVALLLPMTGQGSEYAVQVAQGAHLAFDRFAELHRDHPELIDFDTRGTMERLNDLIATLAENPECVAVIGPLTSSATMAVASQARSAELPVLTPTATSGDVDRIGEPVFRLVVSEGDQAAAVAEYAVRKSGLTRFAIIHPYTAQAQGEVEQFRTTVESLGGTVVSSQGYQPGSTDFKDQIMAVKAYSPQAVFLPVSAWDAVQIAPQLRFYRVDVPLFGTSGWDDELLLRHGGEYVEDAVFTAAFGLSSLYPETARFVYTFTRATGNEPTSIAAQGYDAAGIILQAWESAGEPSRSRVLRKLASAGAYYGASGRCVLGSSSENRITWPMMTVIEGEILSVE
ncbi:hypothetical protein CSA37_01800 [Candidatus Fermentibacteria bacterium]|nr:MAG: hypothetical protein CSA37_01800 [Candidatus Fermentibacteria bacterium]